MLQVGFEPIISAGERQQTYAVDRAATGIGPIYNYVYQKTTSLLVSRSVLRTYYLHLPRGKSEDADTNSYELLLPNDRFTTCYNP